MMHRMWFIPVALAVLLCVGAPATAHEPAHEPAHEDTLRQATFAGGCFWCMEPPFDALDGVVKTISGYSGGHVANPGYQAVSKGTTGHAEVVQISYDPSVVSYQELLAVFWKNIDPLTPNRQFCDRGAQYRSAIFYHDEQQRRLAEASLEALRENKPFAGAIVTEISALKNFYPAEDYHQDYARKNPIRYKFYRHRCGRDQRLEQLWGGQSPS